MQLKDYYSILGLSPSASVDEIKKAYRKLAHQYHPDKRGNDPYATAQFAEIKEAYETLINPLSKEYYLQQRWYAQSIGRIKPSRAITPVSILKQLLELDRYVHSLDEHRMDKTGLYHYINDILSDEAIRELNYFNEPAVNKEIILSALKSGRLLPWQLVHDFTNKLKKIGIEDISVSEAIEKFIRHKRQANYWERQRIWIVMVIVVILCAIIFLMAKK